MEQTIMDEVRVPRIFVAISNAGKLETLQSFIFINRWFALILKINIGGLHVVTKQNFTRSCFVLWYCVFGFSAPHSSTTGARVWSSSLKYLASRNYLKLCFTILDNNSWSLQWFNFSIICQLVEINVGWTIIYFHSFCKCFKLLEQIYIISFEYVFILLFKFGSINTNTQHNFYTLKVILVLEGEFRFNGYCSYGELNWTFSMKLQWEILQQGPRKLSPPGSQN